AAGAEDEEVAVCTSAKRVGTTDGDTQRGETGLAAEVAHEREEGFDFGNRRRGRQDDGGFAEIGKTREGKAGVREDLQVRQRGPMLITAKVEVGVAQDGA